MSMPGKGTEVPGKKKIKKLIWSTNMFAVLLATRLNFEDHVGLTKDLLEKPKNIVAILDCGPMADDCNELQDGGDYY